MHYKKCNDCETNQPLHLYSKNAAGDYRAKCDTCISALKPLHRLQQAKPAPKDEHPLPKIVVEALMGEHEEIVSFDVAKGTRVMSGNVAKKLLNMPPKL